MSAKTATEEFMEGPLALWVSKLSAVYTVGLCWFDMFLIYLLRSVSGTRPVQYLFLHCFLPFCLMAFSSLGATLFVGTRTGFQPDHLL